MEYNLFLTNVSPYEIIGYNGNNSRGYVRYAVDWSSFLKKDCPYIMSIVIRTRIINRQNGDFILKAYGLNAYNYTAGLTTEKQSSLVIGIMKNAGVAKNNDSLASYISYKNGFKTYLPKRPQSNFFDIEILTISGNPVNVGGGNEHAYALIMNFKEVLPDITRPLNPKRHQITFSSLNALNAPLQFSGDTAIFYVDWTFLDERPYLMTFQFYTTISSGTANQQAGHFSNIQVQNAIGVNTLTNGLIQNQYTGCFGISRTRSYQINGLAQIQSDVDDNTPSTILTRPSSNVFEYYNTGFGFIVRSLSTYQYRLILSFTEL
jgi:hypothetical protein